MRGNTWGRALRFAREAALETAPHGGPWRPGRPRPGPRHHVHGARWRLGTAPRGSAAGEVDTKTPGGLRHRLLPQPHGFEGLCLVEEGPNTAHLPVPEIDQVGEWRIDLGSTCSATRTHPAARDESISKVSNLGDLDVKLGERRIQLAEPVTNSLVSSVNGRLAPEQHLKHRLPLHVGVEILQERVDVAEVVRLNLSAWLDGFCGAKRSYWWLWRAKRSSAPAL